MNIPQPQCLFAENGPRNSVHKLLSMTQEPLHSHTSITAQKQIDQKVAHNLVGRMNSTNNLMRGFKNCANFLDFALDCLSI